MIFRIPDSDLLSYIQRADKDLLNTNNSNLFKKHFDYFNNNTFWTSDKTYDFFYKNYKAMNLDSTKIIDIGCHVGPLIMYLKHKGIWNEFEYTGCDLIKNALEICKAHFDDGKYILADAQEEITKDYYDIVYTKGTIISTYFPNKSLNSILNIPSKYVFLGHQPLFDGNNEEKAFESIMVVKEDEIYTSSVLYKDYFMCVINERNLKIKAIQKRLLPTRIKNFKSYFIYDILLER